MTDCTNPHNTDHNYNQSMFQAVVFFCFIVFGLVLSTLFVDEIYLSIKTLVVAMFMLFAVGFYAIGHYANPLSLLSRLYLLLYVLPFSVMSGFLFDENYQWEYVPLLRKPADDPVIVAQVITIGLVGLCGLVVGIMISHLAARKRQIITGPLPYTRKRSLDIVIFIVLVAIAAAFLLASTSPETIFTASYAFGQSETVSEKLNFPAAGLGGFVLFSLLLLDFERDPSLWRRLIKIWFLGAVSLFVISFQILTGDRDSAAFLVAVAVIFVSRPVARLDLASRTEMMRNRMKKVLVPLIIMVLAFLFLGAIRGNFGIVSKLGPIEILQAGFQQNTWTAVLRTNMSLGYEYRMGAIDLKMGSTYKDYFLSLPPGAITKALNIERPMESWKGPSWEVARTIPTTGGLHAVVVPFWNFGIFGAFFILSIFGFLIGCTERKAYDYTFWNRLMWVAFFLASFEWFWYGDMTFIRTLMIAFLAGLAYQVLLRFRFGNNGKSSLTTSVV